MYNCITYIIEYVVQNNSGAYICESYNTKDGIDSRTNNSVEIEIGKSVFYSFNIVILYELTKTSTV